MSAHAIETTAAKRRRAIKALTTDDLHAILCCLSKDIEYYRERINSPFIGPVARAMWEAGLAQRQSAYDRVMTISTLTVPF